MRIVKLIALALTTALIVSATACGDFAKDGASETADEPKKSNLEIAREVAQEIIDCFIDKDEEALYELLGKEAQEFPKVKEQIKEAFDFIDGEIVSFELPTKSDIGGRVWKNGRITSENITPWIKNIETTSGKIYRITFQYFTIFENDKSLEGLGQIHVSLLDENKAMVERLPIGFEPDKDYRFPQ